MNQDWLIAFVVAPAVVVLVSAALVYVTGRADSKARRNVTVPLAKQG